MSEKQDIKAKIRQAQFEAAKQDLFHRTDEELADSLIQNFREENIDESSVPHAAQDRGGLGDLIEKVMGKPLEKVQGVDPRAHVKYAEQFGMGNMQYELVEV